MNKRLRFETMQLLDMKENPLNFIPASQEMVNLDNLMTCLIIISLSVSKDIVNLCTQRIVVMIQKENLNYNAADRSQYAEQAINQVINGLLRLEQHLIRDILHSHGPAQQNLFAALINFTHWQYFSTRIFLSSLDRYFHDIILNSANDPRSELRRIECVQVMLQLNLDERLYAWNGLYAAIEVILLNCTSSNSLCIDEDLLAQLLRLLGDESQLLTLEERLLQKLQATLHLESLVLTLFLLVMQALADNNPTPQLVIMIQKVIQQYLPSFSITCKRRYISIVRSLSSLSLCAELVQQVSEDMGFVRQIRDDNVLSSSSFVHINFEPVFIVALSKVTVDGNDDHDDLKALLLTNLATELLEQALSITALKEKLQLITSQLEFISEESFVSGVVLSMERQDNEASSSSQPSKRKRYDLDSPQPPPLIQQQDDNWQDHTTSEEVLWSCCCRPSQLFANSFSLPFDDLPPRVIFRLAIERLLCSIYLAHRQITWRKQLNVQQLELQQGEIVFVAINQILSQLNLCRYLLLLTRRQIATAKNRSKAYTSPTRKKDNIVSVVLNTEDQLINEANLIDIEKYCEESVLSIIPSELWTLALNCITNSFVKISEEQEWLPTLWRYSSGIYIIQEHFYIQHVRRSHLQSDNLRSQLVTQLNDKKDDECNSCIIRLLRYLPVLMVEIELQRRNPTSSNQSNAHLENIVVKGDHNLFDDVCISDVVGLVANNHDYKVIVCVMLMWFEKLLVAEDSHEVADMVCRELCQGQRMVNNYLQIKGIDSYKQSNNDSLLDQDMEQLSSTQRIYYILEWHLLAHQDALLLLTGMKTLKNIAIKINFQTKFAVFCYRLQRSIITEYQLLPSTLVQQFLFSNDDQSASFSMYGCTWRVVDYALNGSEEFAQKIRLFVSCLSSPSSKSKTATGNNAFSIQALNMIPQIATVYRLWSECVAMLSNGDYFPFTVLISRDIYTNITVRRKFSLQTNTFVENIEDEGDGDDVMDVERRNESEIRSHKCVFPSLRDESLQLIALDILNRLLPSLFAHSAVMNEAMIVVMSAVQMITAMMTAKNEYVTIKWNLMVPNVCSRLSDMLKSMVTCLKQVGESTDRQLLLLAAAVIMSVTHFAQLAQVLLPSSSFSAIESTVHADLTKALKDTMLFVEQLYETLEGEGNELDLEECDQLAAAVMKATLQPQLIVSLGGTLSRELQVVIRQLWNGTVRTHLMNYGADHDGWLYAGLEAGIRMLTEEATSQSSWGIYKQT